MYRELIASLIRPFKSAALQPPCTQEQIQRAEEYAGCAFPEELRALLRETDGDRWFLMSAKEISENIRRNREIMADYFESEEEFLQKVDRHIFFATNGCGDYYCYRILPNGKADASAIYLWEHELFESHIVARSLPELIRGYYSGIL